jgi:hypothetical protein
MALIDVETIKNDVISFVEGNLNEAKEDLRSYIESKSDDYQAWVRDVADGKITQDMLKSLLRAEKNVITAILLRHKLELGLDTQEKVLDWAEKIIAILLQALISAI